MLELKNDHLKLCLDPKLGSLLAVSHADSGESLFGEQPLPLFALRLRDDAGKATELDAGDASHLAIARSNDQSGESLSLRFSGFPQRVSEVHVVVRLESGSALSHWSFEAMLDSGGGYVEWVSFPGVSVPNDLVATGGEGRILWPALEGLLIEDVAQRERGHLPYQAIEYPNRGWCGYYPGCAPMPFLAYYRESGDGLYLGAHDPDFATREVEYCAVEGGVRLLLKTYPGAPDHGAFGLSGDFVLGVFRGDWHDAADIYRNWALQTLPSLPPKTHENNAIPEWIKDSPLVVTYPVTGSGHHSGPTQPNEYHPFTEAMPHLDRLSEDVDSPLLALLMQWEGTAPWAPPYVWPPLGGEQNLAAFADRLHEKGHHLGLYCSGLAWTNTADTGPGDYQRLEEFEKEGRIKEMCQGPEGDYQCLICNGEGIRLGYDMCAASEFASSVATEEAVKIAEAGVDYIQLLDQNLGGAAYQCHDAAHGHPPAPGPWQAKAMRNFLERVQTEFAAAGRGEVILGCEAAAAEAYIDHLPVNDLRYQMGFNMGRPVPLYSYVYHEYCVNFMGNQVEAMVYIDKEKSPENLMLRLAYSFTAGDLLTAVLADGGEIHWSWCTKWEVPKPDQVPLRQFLSHLNAWRRGIGKDFLVFGQMLKPRPAKVAETVALHLTNDTVLEYPAVMSTRWRAPDGREAQFFVNYTDRPQNVELGSGDWFDGKIYDSPDASQGIAPERGIELPPLNAVLWQSS